MRVRHFFSALCAASVVLVSATAIADTYPSRAVRIVVPYGTGGGSDILARQLGVVLQQMWGQGVTVENKAGASGNIGSAEVVPTTGFACSLRGGCQDAGLGEPPT